MPLLLSPMLLLLHPELNPQPNPVFLLFKLPVKIPASSCPKTNMTEKTGKKKLEIFNP